MSRFTAVLLVLLGVYIGYRLIDRFEPASIKGKRVIVTGASAGIGEQLAYHYARLGAKLVITARRESRLKEVIAKCRLEGDPHGDYHYVVADMGEEAAAEKVIKEGVAKLGGLDFLVLNHIIVVPLKEWEGSGDDFMTLSKIMDINFKAYVHLASHAMPHLEKTNGSIVVVSSVAGKLANPYTPAYSASKFALDGFFSALRQELYLKNVDVSITLCVIGLIGTDSARTGLKNFGLSFLIDKLGMADPGDTALAIIKGGALRERQMYYPPEAYFVTKLRDIIPEALEAMLRYLYNRS